jgi:hypothetical protein
VFKKSKMQITGTAEELFKILAELKASDTKAEGRKKVGCGTAVVGALGIAPIAMFADSWSDSQLMAAGIIVGVLIVVGVSIYAFFNAFDLDDDIQDSAKELLKFLSEDVNPKSSLGLVLDFSNSTDKRHLLRKDPPKKKSGGYSTKTITTSHYKHSVLTLKARLQDGTRLSIGLARRIKSLSIKKSKPGKTKYYTQTYTKPIISLMAVVPKERYGEIGALSSRLRSAPVQGFQVSRLNVEGQKVQATMVGGVNQPNQGSADSCLRALVWLFYELRKNKAGMIAS